MLADAARSKPLLCQKGAFISILVLPVFRHTERGKEGERRL